MKLIRGKQIQPRRTLLYGVHGIGKSTWAAQAPGCVVLNLEDGLNDIDCVKTEHLTTLESVNEALMWLANVKHDFRTVAIDSVDWLESLIQKEVITKHGKETMADFGWGKGHQATGKVWDDILFKLEWLRTEHQMNIVLLAHCEIVRFQDPESESYDRYQPALHKLAAAMLQEWCDEVLFASYRTYTRKEDLGFSKERNIAIGSGERYIRTQESAVCMAKNRLSLPPEIEFTWEAYASHFPKHSSSSVPVPVAEKA